jgi:hypothetical protein
MRVYKFKFCDPDNLLCKLSLIYTYLAISDFQRREDVTSHLGIQLRAA